MSEFEVDVYRSSQGEGRPVHLTVDAVDHQHYFELTDTEAVQLLVDICREVKL